MKETTRNAVDGLMGCVEFALRSVKCQTSCILKSKSMPCQTSRLPALVPVLSPTSPFLLGLGYISSVEKRKQFLTFKCETEMWNFSQDPDPVGVSR